jgi:hypothetical protein
MESVRVLDSATKLATADRGAVVVCGSHGGTFPAWLAARAGVRAIVLNDAGFGLDRAGVGGVAWLDGLGIAACAVGGSSARIGDARDTLESGILSTVNDTAARAGCEIGMACREAARRLSEATGVEPRSIPERGESRMAIPNTGHRAAWTLDSMSLVKETDAHAILVTGSHGALLGGRPDDGMLAVPIHAAIFNDAGGGKDGAGYARLAVLDRRGIAAATVSAATARIGDGRSTWETGVLSRVNAAAARLDLAEGLTCREAVARLLGLG